MPEFSARFPDSSFAPLPNHSLSSVVNLTLLPPLPPLCHHHDVENVDVGEMADVKDPGSCVPSQKNRRGRRALRETVLQGQEERWQASKRPSPKR